MRNLEDIIKAAFVFIVGISMMSALATLPGGESFANLGKLLMLMALLIVVVSFIVPIIKKIR